MISASSQRPAPIWMQAGTYSPTLGYRHTGQTGNGFDQTVIKGSRSDNRTHRSDSQKTPPHHALDDRARGENDAGGEDAYRDGKDDQDSAGRGCPQVAPAFLPTRTDL